VRQLAAAFFTEVLERASSLAPKFNGTIINFQLSNVQANTTSCPDGVRLGAESGSKLPHCYVNVKFFFDLLRDFCISRSRKMFCSQEVCLVVRFSFR
jgi:hypothetical protein